VQGFFFTQWMWLVAALVLLIFELILPGTFFVWLGLAAGMVALSVWAMFLPVSAQLGLFALYSLVAIFLGRRLQYGRAPKVPSVLNRGPDALVGELVTVAKAIENGRGRVKVGDTSWLARGPDLPQGAVARITGHDGGTLTVEPADAQP